VNVETFELERSYQTESTINLCIERINDSMFVIGGIEFDSKAIQMFSVDKDVNLSGNFIGHKDHTTCLIKTQDN
jgi:hypothetical protein